MNNTAIIKEADNYAIESYVSNYQQQFGITGLADRKLAIKFNLSDAIEIAHRLTALTGRRHTYELLD